MDESKLGHTMRIFVHGLSKSGTSAFAYKVYNSLPRESTRLLFERRRYRQGNYAKFEVAKSVLDRTLIAKYGDDPSPLGDRDLSSFDCFEKRILIVRDPRDRIVSSALFGCFEPSIARDETFMLSYIEFLRLKEAHPESIRFYDLLRFIRSYPRFADKVTSKLPVWPMDNETHWNRPIDEWLINYERERRDFFLVYYEDFIAGELSGVEEYLGVKLTGVPALPKDLNHIARTRAAGDYKNWFTREDNEYFKEHFRVFFDYHTRYQQFGDQPIKVILPENASDYVRRVANRRRKMLGLAPLSNYSTSDT